MSYRFYPDEKCIVLTTSTGNIAIPAKAGNADYQAVLDSINTDGSDAWDDTVATYDDIPEDLRTAAESKKFNQQLKDYKVAKARLEQYVVATGRAEVREMQPTGEQTFNEETGEMEDVMQEVITVTAIEPVEATVTRMVYDEANPEAEPTEETVENPLITKDNEERAAAQAVVDATPQAVKDAV